ncbi:MAG: hypothetical protein AAB905_00665, partial [Patescibacteria group bacterium]
NPPVSLSLTHKFSQRLKDYDPIYGFAVKFQERLFFNGTNRFDAITSIRYLERENADGDLLANLYHSRVERLFQDSITQAAREWMLEMPFTDWFLTEIRDITSDAIARSFSRTLSGREELDNLVSSFSDKEERITLDGGRIRRGLKWSLRPFRTSPYVSGTYGLEDGNGGGLAALSIRYYAHEWNPGNPITELLARVPLHVGNWVVATGIRYEPERAERDSGSYVFGIEGKMLDGSVFLRTDSSGGIFLSFAKFL